MSRIFTYLLVAMITMATTVMAEDNRNKMSFVVDGPEDSYNMIRVINHSSHSDFKCRVVFLTEDDRVRSTYGTYSLKGYDDADSNSKIIRQGTRVGIQMAKDFPAEVNFSVEYRDYPLYDAIFIYILDANSSYDETF